MYLIAEMWKCGQKRKGKEPEMKKIRTTLGQGWNAATTGLEREAGGVGFRWHETHPQN